MLLVLLGTARRFGNRKKSLQGSATDIVSISTGRESLLIGPSAAFGAKTRNLILRDRTRLRHTLDTFMTRPGAVDLLRPSLRRWGIHAGHSHLSEKDSIKDALLRASSSGQLSIVVVPEVTLAFSKVHAASSYSFDAAIATPTPAGNVLPDKIQDRLVLVFEMVPDHMAGATRQAFEDALVNTGVGIIVGGLMTWLGAHLVPGVNVAVIAFDLFFLGSDVLRACETIGSTLDDIARAKSHADLEPAAKVIAGAIAVLLVAGIFHRLMKAKQVTKGAAKEGGGLSTDKPFFAKSEARAREPRIPKQDPVPIETVLTPRQKRRAEKFGKEEAAKVRKQQDRVRTAQARQQKVLEDDVGYNISPNSYDNYPTVGKHGTFVTDGQEIDKVFAKLKTNRNGEFVMSKDDAVELERTMGLKRGSLSEGFKVRQVKGLTGARSPLQGNKDFLGPGQHLHGGAPEMVIDPISPQDGGAVATYMKVLVK